MRRGMRWTQRALFAALTLSAIGIAEALPIRTVALTGDLAPGTSNTFTRFDAPGLNASGRVAFSGDAGQRSAWTEGADGVLKLFARPGDPAPDGSGTYTSFGGPQIADGGQTVLFGGIDVNGTVEDAIISDRSGTTSVVARSGAPAPTTGNNFIELRTPVLDANGGATFFARTDVGFRPQGIWSDSGGTLAPIALGNDPAPGTPNVFNDFRDPSVNAGGEVAFRAGLNGLVEGIWSSAGGLHEVVRNGDAAPGSGDIFDSFFNPVINNAGETAFRARLNTTLSGERGLFAERNGSLELMARTGQTAPGSSRIFTDFTDPLGNVGGHFLFNAELDGGAGEGIFKNVNGSLSSLAISGDMAPGTSQTFSAFFTPQLNAAGHTLFLGALDNGDRGFWLERSGVVDLVLRVGDLLEVRPGDHRTVTSLGQVFEAGTGGRQRMFNDAGQFTFIAHFSDGSSGVFVSSGAVAASSPGTVGLVLASLVLVAFRGRRFHSQRF